MRTCTNRITRAILAFVFVLLVGPVLLCVLVAGHVQSSKILALMPGFVVAGAPASAAVGLGAAVSIMVYDTIRIQALLAPLLLVVLAVALLTGPSPVSFWRGYGFWYSGLAALATALIAWPAKMLFDRPNRTADATA